MREFKVIWGLSGKSVSVFYTEYHADQFIRALLLNGTPARLA